MNDGRERERDGIEATEHSNLKRCTYSDLGIKINGEGAAEVLEALDCYLADFVKPTGSCFKCSSGIRGSFFEYGLATGEGYCSSCGWPARALHSPKNDKGRLFDRLLEFVLQYHPDNVERA